MRKRIFSALMISLLLLSGCSGKQIKPEEQFALLRSSVRAAQSISCNMTLHWDDGETVSDYLLDISFDGESCRISVVQPELIAGVEATVGTDGAVLGTSRLMLETGSVGDISPMTVPALLLRLMGYGYTELFWQEDDLSAVRLQRSDTEAAELWLNGNGTPVCAVFFCGGTAVASCSIENWTVN